MRTNLHHLLQDAAQAGPDAPAATYKDVTLSYRELWRRVCGVAVGLAAVDVVRGDRVAVYLEKRLETVAAIFGTSAAGGAFVPVNPVLKPQQVGYILSDCGVRVLLTSAERLHTLRAELMRCPSLEHVVIVDAHTAVSEEPPPANYEVHDWDDVFRSTDQPCWDSGPIDLDMAAILYTSGSTGKPKGVVLSHRNLIAGAESVSHYLANRSDDVILSALPLSFDAGFSQLTTGFSVGAHVILMNYLVPGDVVRLCVAHGVTGLTGVPPLWIQIAEQNWPPDASRRLRYFANTGGRMPKATLDRLRGHFPHAKPYLMYGLTEAFRSTYLDPAEVDRRPSSIGKAIPNAEVLVLRQDGSPCAAGEEGELVHRGALVAMGYWNDPKLTSVRFRPVPGRDVNWRNPEMAVWSGDTVVADTEGFLYFVGRSDEMIKTSGFRVSPAEVEEVAYDTGLVRDAVALGMEDAQLGQRIVLIATPIGPEHLDVELLLAAMRRELPRYMVPSDIKVIDHIPKSPNGKFDRGLLRKEMQP